MRSETKSIVGEVEERSGLPVQIVAVKDLPVAAKVTLSPHVSGSYVIQVRAGLAYQDYAVAFQCGHILRTLAVPEAERVQLASTRSAEIWTGKLVRAHMTARRHPPLPDAVLAGFVEHLVGGLCTQLRSIPVGMRVDAWLTGNYPTLRGAQWEAVAVQQQEALGCLSPMVRESVPDEILAGSILLNAAYALFCDRLLGAATYAVPYGAAGFGDLGRALLAIFDEVPDDPTSDRALVDRWGAELGLTERYAWVPFPAGKFTVS